MLNVKYKDKEYPLATTLRVAYRIQGQHNHKPYTEIFKSVGDMTLEDQVGIIYEAFLCGSRYDLNVQAIKRNDFLEDYLDNYTLTEMMSQLQEIIQGIVGTDASENANENTDEEQGN